jgi:integrase
MTTVDRQQLIEKAAEGAAALTKPGLHRIDDGGSGLYLQITSARARSWIYRFQLHGVTRDMGLGPALAAPPVRAVTLVEASKLADEARRLRAQGIDPVKQRKDKLVEERRDSVKAVTFKQCAEEYIEHNKAGWKNDKHKAQWYMTMLGRLPPEKGGKPTKQNYCRALHAKPIGEITVTDVLDVLRPIWLTKTETASRIRNRIELVINYATPTYRSGDNPATVAILKSKLPKVSKVRRVKHHRSLPYRELPGFMKDLRSRPGVSCRALEFAILTVARTDEVLSARWAQIDWEEGYWNLDPEVMKNDRAHRVWLSPRALQILREMHAKRDGDYIFPGKKVGATLSENSLIKVVQLMGYHDRAVPHGFRGTFSTWAEKEARDKDGLRFPDPMIELCMSHEVGSEVRRAYKRPDGRDLRQELLEVWSGYCASPPTVTKVLTLHKPQDLTADDLLKMVEDNLG